VIPRILTHHASNRSKGLTSARSLP